MSLLFMDSPLMGVYVRKFTHMPSLVDNEEFITLLTALFDSTKESGSVWLTLKRYKPHDAEGNNVESHPPNQSQYPCLIRASNGDKSSKFSTLVTYDRLPKFHAILGSLLKGSMNSMRKRDKKRERLKADRLAAKKKMIQEPIEVRGVKRGNGRRKRQRLISAIKKQEDAIRKQEEKEQLRTRQALNKPL